MKWAWTASPARLAGLFGGIGAPRNRRRGTARGRNCGALVVDVVWDILAANVVSMEMCVDPDDLFSPTRAEILDRGFLWLGLA